MAIEATSRAVVVDGILAKVLEAITKWPTLETTPWGTPPDPAQLAKEIRLIVVGGLRAAGIERFEPTRAVDAPVEDAAPEDAGTPTPYGAGAWELPAE